MHIASCITREFLKHCFDIKDINWQCVQLSTKSGVDSTDPLIFRAVEGNSLEIGKARGKQLNTSLRPMYN